MTTNNEYSERIKAEFEDILFEKKAILEKRLREEKRSLKHYEQKGMVTPAKYCNQLISELSNDLLTINEWLDKINN